MGVNFLEQIASFQNQEKTLIAVNDERLSYAAFNRAVEQISRRLKYLGVQAHDKVGIVLPNCTLWYTFFWAAVKIGAQPVPIDPQSGYWELKSLSDLVELKVCVVVPKYRSNEIINHMRTIQQSTSNLVQIVVLNTSESVAEETGIISLDTFMKLPEEVYESYMPDAQHILELACTSGTTGNPKILEVPYIGFYTALWEMSQYLGITQDDCMLIGMPLYHQGGFGMGLQAVLQGGSVIYEPRFNPESFLNRIEEGQVTIIQLTTTLAKILISTPGFFERDFSRVKLCYFAGEVLPDEVAACFYEKLGIRVVNIIGSSETATMVVWDSKDDLEVTCNTFKVLPFTDAKIFKQEGAEVKEGEVGELFIATSGLINAYYKNPSENAARFCMIEGKRYFKTGDMVQQEKDGYIRFVGRYKRIIKRGANLVYAEEVESFLLTHPDIEAVAVKKEDNEILGEAIVAYVQTKNQQPLTRGDVLRFSKNKISAYKIPDQIIVVDEVPHDIGKIQFKYIK